MKFYTRLPQSLKPYYDQELQHYTEAYSNGHLQIAWQHLERAHIIGQRYPFAHSYVHWKMLQFGLKITPLLTKNGKTKKMKNVFYKNIFTIFFLTTLLVISSCEPFVISPP